MMPNVQLFPTLADVSARVAEAAAEIVTTAVRARGTCALVLSGGDTPRGLYEVLATKFGSQLPWDRVHVFWSDERLVPAGDPRRNDRMARETLLSKVPCPETNIHPMAPGSRSPDEAARDYEETLKRYFPDGPPRFDLVLLGLGVDGHTASLFPHSPALDEQQRWVREVLEAPANPRARLTLTLAALTHAAHVFFLVSGATKSHALRMALDRQADARKCPAAAVRPVNGELTWWVDAAAADKGDSAEHKGAVEQTAHDPIAPVSPIGANFEDSEVANASETGKTTDVPRDEQRRLFG